MQKTQFITEVYMECAVQRAGVSQIHSKDTWRPKKAVPRCQFPGLLASALAFSLMGSAQLRTVSNKVVPSTSLFSPSQDTIAPMAH